jgi:hypothetical protein
MSTNQVSYLHNREPLNPEPFNCSFHTRLKEHIYDTNHGQTKKYFISKHSSNTKHMIFFDQLIPTTLPTLLEKQYKSRNTLIILMKKMVSNLSLPRQSMIKFNNHQICVDLVIRYKLQLDCWKSSLYPMQRLIHMFLWDQ